VPEIGSYGDPDTLIEYFDDSDQSH